MAEFMRFDGNRMGFSDVLAVIERWDREEAIPEEAVEELEQCRKALEGQDDALSQMAKARVEQLLERAGCA